MVVYQNTLVIKIVFIQTDHDKSDLKLWLLLQLTHLRTVVDVKTKTFLYTIINITIEKCCSVAFICLATRHHFIHRFKELELPCTAEKNRSARECWWIAFIFNCHTYILSARNEAEVRAILFGMISSIPHSSNFRKNGYQLWVQCFVGSFSWINVSYHWSVVSKATIN